MKLIKSLKYDLQKASENDSEIYALIDVDKKKIYKINEYIYSIINIFSESKTINTGFREFLKVYEIKDDSKDVFEKFVFELKNNRILIDDVQKKEKKYLNHFLENFEKQNINDLVTLHNTSKSTIFLNKEKVIKFSKKLSNKTVLALGREVHYLKLLESYNITPKLISYDLKKGMIETEYFNGITLKEHVLKNRNNNYNKKELFLSILKVYVKLEQQKLLHGDIHYGNILVSETKSIKLVDLEFMVLESELKKPKVGVDFFTPPERLASVSLEKIVYPTNKKGEIYQLTLLLFFIVFEKIPFTGDTWKELYNNIISWNVDLSISERNLIDKNTFEFLKRGLNFNPNERFNNFQEMYNIWKK